MPQLPGDFLARAQYGRFAAPTATTTTLAAIGTTDEARIDGALITVLADSSLWTFDAESVAGAGATVVVPDAGTGRWLKHSTSAPAASAVTIADAGNFTAQTEVEAATQEIYQHIKSVQKQVNIPLTSFLDADGDPPIKFSNGVNDGWNLADSEALGYRWNNDAAPPLIRTTVPMPQDVDDGANVVVHALVSKSGATLADATKLTMTAFFVTPGALHDADADCGGDSDAVVGDLAAKTVSELTLTLALADVPASPSALNLSIKPKDGTLGTDDLILHGAWLEYKGKVLTS